MARDEEATWKQRGRKLLFWLIVLEIVGVLVFIAGLAIGESSRPTFMLIYAPRQPLLVVTVLGAALAHLTKRRVRVLQIVNVLLSLVVLFPVMGMHVGWSRSPSTDKKPIRLASYNVYFGKLNRQELMNELLAMDVDILLIQAPHESMAKRLKERFPDRNIEFFDDHVIVTRFKIREMIKPKPINEDVTSKWVGYILETESGPLDVYNVHPFSPRYALLGADMEPNIDSRELQIDGAVQAAQAGGTPFIIAGDTNLPPWSGIGRRRLGPLTDAWDEVGFGFGYTFPAKRPWMRIDRAFGEGVRFLEMHVGKLGQSDHRPIFVTFEITNR
jgi:endonuclease/exonuclease/phosphatase (EEP) superfamily protein YafD